MSNRRNYTSEQIDAEDAARERFDTSPSEKTLKRLEEETKRTKRAIIHAETIGQGRSSGRGGPDLRKGKNMGDIK